MDLTISHYSLFLQNSIFLQRSLLLSRVSYFGRTIRSFRVCKYLAAYSKEILKFIASAIFLNFLSKLKFMFKLINLLRICYKFPSVGYSCIFQGGGASWPHKFFSRKYANVILMRLKFHRFGTEESKALSKTSSALPPLSVNQNFLLTLIFAQH